MNLAPSEEQKIKKYAQEQIEMTKKIFNVDIHGDEKSILALDAIIEQGWGAKPPNNLEHAIIFFGSFFGEALMTTFAKLGYIGVWTRNEGVSDWPVLQYDIPQKGPCFFNPFGKIQKRFMNGMEDSISYYYQCLKNGLATNFDVPELKKQ